jgi:hypothetical protein
MGKKANMKKSNKNMVKPKKKRFKLDSLDVMALLIFIVIGLGIIAGSVWYYAFHLPQATREMERVTHAFVDEWFNIHYETATGLEGVDYRTASLAATIRRDANTFVNRYRDDKLVRSVKGDVEVQILERGWNSGKTRAVFLLVEERDGKAKEILYYFDYNFSLENGNWLINTVYTPNARELEAFQKARGWEAPAEDDENGEDEDGAEN